MKLPKDNTKNQIKISWILTLGITRHLYVLHLIKTFTINRRRQQAGGQN